MARARRPDAMAKNGVRASSGWHSRRRAASFPYFWRDARLRWTFAGSFSRGAHNLIPELQPDLNGVKAMFHPELQPELHT
jgi:hypothetical protein